MQIQNIITRFDHERGAGAAAAPAPLRETICAQSRAYFKSNVSQPSLRNTRPHS